MGWAEIKKRYESGGASASQSTENMAARRILHALGITEQLLSSAEAGAGLSYVKDATLLERSEGLVMYYSTAGMLRLRSHLPPVRDVKSTKEADEIVLELAEQWRGRADLVYRIRGTDHLRAVIRLGSTLVDTDLLPMPCSLRRSKDESCVLLDCEAQPYYSTVIRWETNNG